MVLEKFVEAESEKVPGPSSPPPRPTITSFNFTEQQTLRVWAKLYQFMRSQLVRSCEWLPWCNSLWNTFVFDGVVCRLRRVLGLDGQGHCPHCLSQDIVQFAHIPKTATKVFM